MLHTIVTLVEDKPAVLNRIASLLRRRMLNVESLTAARTTRPGVTRLTVVVDTDEVGAGRVVATLYKLVNVIEAQDLRDDDAIARDIALVKVATSNGSTDALARVIDETGGRIVDRGATTATVEISGEPGQIDAAMERLSSLGIVDMARSGRVSISRGDHALGERDR